MWTGVGDFFAQEYFAPGYFAHGYFAQGYFAQGYFAHGYFAQGYFARIAKQCWASTRCQSGVVAMQYPSIKTCAKCYKKVESGVILFKRKL